MRIMNGFTEAIYKMCEVPAIAKRNWIIPDELKKYDISFTSRASDYGVRAGKLENPSAVVILWLICILCTNKNCCFSGDSKILSRKVSDQVRIRCHTL